MFKFFVLFFHLLLSPTFLKFSLYMANKFDCENIVYVGNEILNERSIIKKIKISSLPKNKIIEQLTYKLYHQSQNSYENSTQLDDNTITKSLILGIDIFKQKNTESIITLLSKFFWIFLPYVL